MLLARESVEEEKGGRESGDREPRETVSSGPCKMILMFSLMMSKGRIAVSELIVPETSVQFKGARDLLSTRGLSSMPRQVIEPCPPLIRISASSKTDLSRK